MARASEEVRKHARAMRTESTHAEDRLWRLLRDRRFEGHKFRRQVPIGPYIVDFYCAELKRAIEADGRHHESAWRNEYESERTGFLESRAIEVLRLPNDLVMRNLQTVEEAIRWAIERRKA